MEKNLKKKLIIFDFDGVLFDSLDNMKISWEYVKKKYSLKTDFKNYVQYLGLPFKEILSNLKINSNHTEISKYYKFISEKNLDLIIPFDKVIKTLNILKKNKIKIAICTSKDFVRTKKVIDKYNLKFDAIEADTNNKKTHKPEPHQLIDIMDKLGIEKKHTVYIGDTFVDYLTSKNANIDYFHAGWGYAYINEKVIILDNINEIFDYV